MITQKDRQLQDEFMTLYEGVHNKFVRYCMAVAGDEQSSKDLVNETLLRAFENFVKIQKKQSFLFFLIGTAKRVWSNERRKNKIWKDVAEGELDDHKGRHGNDSEMKMDALLLYRAMERLPGEQKEALILFEILGFSIKEIEKIQNSSESAIKVRLMRGRKKLASLLSDLETKKAV